MRFYTAMAMLLAIAATGIGSALAHPGGLDANGCHYDTSNRKYHCHRTVKPNPDVAAPVKKSRLNICHDHSSSNYRNIRFFISFQTLAECVKSGGIAAK
jgi:hypothetical protein